MSNEATGALVDAPLNVQPPGLLALFQLKSLGRAPRVLSTTLAGTIDLRDWYMQARFKATIDFFGANPTAGPFVTGVNGFQNFQVAGVDFVTPQNQWTYALDLAVTATIALAADTVRFSIGVSPPGAGAYLISDDFNDIVTANARVAGKRVVNPLWISPGSKLSVLIHSLTSVGGLTFGLTGRFVPLQV